jgi:hypothetical protein
MMSNTTVTAAADVAAQITRTFNRKLGFPVIKSGDYGLIRLEHIDSEEGFAYRVSGSNVTDRGWFPSRKDWLRKLSRRAHATYDRESGAWTIPVDNAPSAENINSLLEDILTKAQDPEADPRTGYIKREELEILRHYEEHPVANIELEYLDDFGTRLIKPAIYGLIELSYVVEDGEWVSYLLKGSEYVDDGRFPELRDWMKVLKRREGAEFDHKTGHWIIPVDNQDMANRVHNSLLPILSQALEKLHDFRVWNYAPPTHIPTFILDSGIELIAEGVYGNIRVQHVIAKGAYKEPAYLMYRLTGYKTKNSAFPGKKDWNRLLWESYLARYAKKKRHWNVPLKTPETAREANALLIPILKESILDRHSYVAKRKNAYLKAKIEARLKKHS